MIRVRITILFFRLVKSEVTLGHCESEDSVDVGLAEGTLSDCTLTHRARASPIVRTIIVPSRAKDNLSKLD